MANVFPLIQQSIQSSQWFLTYEIKSLISNLSSFHSFDSSFYNAPLSPLSLPIKTFNNPLIYFFLYISNCSLSTSTEVANLNVGGSGLASISVQTEARKLLSNREAEHNQHPAIWNQTKAAYFLNQN